MNNYKKYNLALGWLCFLISSIVYLLTMEPTASLWDCSEFIATSYKLEIGHPPGAPLFMMIARFFTIFAPNASYAAVMVNTMSCLASGMTIAFLFWTITMLAKKLYRKPADQLTKGETFAVMGAGLIGALAYAFTDTFWFSGVEGEVYALSSLFTAAVFWAMLKWEEVADQPHSTRWLVLIAYLMGLSIGVHLLNLLAFPAMVFIYYFKKYDKVTFKGVLAATAISMAIIVFVLYMIVPYTVSIGATIDRWFVNGLNLPMNSGFAVYAVLLFVLLGLGVYLSHKKGKVVLNTFLLMTTVIILGYSSYATVIIRSAANPPMNSNAPDNPYALSSLLSRDQYGSNPLFKGAYYSVPPIDYKIKTTYYEGADGKYKPVASIIGYEYPATFFFPRMHSMNEQHINAYKQWVDIKGKRVVTDYTTFTVPTFGENLKFFFSYQVNFMYWRYFLWNFAGRQDDVLSNGEITHGNWLSGITPIDEIYLGPQKNLPSELKNNHGRNKYYFLPFILGMLGLFFQVSKDKRGFTVVMWLFVMTGLAIIVYLNQGPAEVRERDYAYAGSFYAFAIWIGLGVLFAYDCFKKAIKKAPVAAIAATAVCTCVPVILIAQNWDDHDRSHRYVARDFGANYLNSTLPNSIIMNFGDNDTFPLWYSQEVEGTRPDVRIMNMMYLSAAWYIDQMKVKANDSDPVPFSIPRDKYTETNTSLRVYDYFDSVTISQALQWIKSDDPLKKDQTLIGNLASTVPSHNILLPVNKQNVLNAGIVKPEDEHLIVDTVYLKIEGNDLSRPDMMFLDLLANFDWKRPLYFTTLSSIVKFGLTEYTQFDGFSYRLVPIKTPYTANTVGRIDTDYMYDNLMNKFKYGNIKDPRVYADHTVNHSFTSTKAKDGFARLADALYAKGDKEKALRVLQRGEEEIPFGRLTYVPTTTVTYIESYYKMEEFEKGNKIADDYIKILKEYLDYYLQFLPTNKFELVYDDIVRHRDTMYYIAILANKYGQNEITKGIEQYFAQKGIQ